MQEPNNTYIGDTRTGLRVMSFSCWIVSSTALEPRGFRSTELRMCAWVHEYACLCAQELYASAAMQAHEGHMRETVLHMKSSKRRNFNEKEQPGKATFLCITTRYTPRSLENRKSLRFRGTILLGANHPPGIYRNHWGPNAHLLIMGKQENINVQKISVIGSL